ncbi:MAG: N-acetyltransferase [Raoultibacter sp.]
MISIRQEKPSDYEAIYELILAAFATAEEADGTEQDLVVKLRKGDAYIPELALVAVEDDVIVGHILYSKIRIGDSRSVALAPLSIAPAHQKLGIGTALMQEGHRLAAELGYEFSVVLGSDCYYPRVGYRPASEFGIVPPFDVPEKNFMAMALQPGAVEYASAFFE